jgi:hypothetical protein
MAELRITGGCQCGAVRYALNGAPTNPSICHCRMCQKHFGNYFGAFVGVHEEEFKLTRGELSVFRSSHDSERLFCARCGTPLGYRRIGRPRVSVSAGSLDHPETVKPVIQYGIEGRVPWLAEILDLPATVTGEGDPAQERYAKIEAGHYQHPDHDTTEWPPVR